MLSLGLVTSCSFTLSARSISKGISVLDSFVESLSEKSSNLLLATNNTTISINAHERCMGDKRKYITVSSFSLDASLSKTDEFDSISYSADWGDSKKSWMTKTENYNTTYIDEEGERSISPSDPFYAMRDMNSYLVDYLNYSVGFMFRAYFNCVYKNDDSIRSALITGLNVDSTSSSSWTFEIWSDYREADESSLGIFEKDYKKFFTYTGIEAVPAYFLKMKIDSGRITQFFANYSYQDSEDEEKTIEGSLEIKVSYGG